MLGALVSNNNWQKHQVPQNCSQKPCSHSKFSNQSVVKMCTFSNYVIKIIKVLKQCF